MSGIAGIQGAMAMGGMAVSMTMGTGASFGAQGAAGGTSALQSQGFGDSAAAPTPGLPEGGALSQQISMSASQCESQGRTDLLAALLIMLLLNRNDENNDKGGAGEMLATLALMGACAKPGESTFSMQSVSMSSAAAGYAGAGPAAGAAVNLQA